MGLLWPNAGETATLVASATILNSVRGPPSTRIGAIFLGKDIAERAGRPAARRSGREEERAARSLQIRTVPPQPAGGGSVQRALDRVSGALRARHPGLARAGDTWVPQGPLQRAICSRVHAHT